MGGFYAHWPAMQAMGSRVLPLMGSRGRQFVSKYDRAGDILPAYFGGYCSSLFDTLRCGGDFAKKVRAAWAARTKNPVVYGASGHTVCRNTWVPVRVAR